MGPKKPKKSKAEQEEERLAREEEERKAKILEDKKNAEEAEKRRLEQLRIEAEHKRQREAELLRLGAEYEEIVDEDKSKELQLAAEEKRENAKLEWARYTDPTDEPDANVEKDMNTFITLTKETHNDDWKATFALIKRVEVIAMAVENVWSESLATRNTVSRQKALRNLLTLRDIIYEKLDVATVKLLAFADEQLNERQELNMETTGYRLSVGLWASYADVRPIRKSVIFESIGIQIDLQKQVLQQHDNFVFRVTRMPIVAYNLEAYDIAPEVVADILATREPTVTTVTEEDGTVTSASRTASPKASPRAAADASAKLPSKYVVGDLIVFDILYAPQPAFHLRVRKWTMRNKSATATKLRKAAYPSSVPSRVQIKIPEDVLMTDDMRVAVWNEEQREWSEDAIGDYQYNETTRTVQFYITTVGILALVKKRVVDLPYKKWSIAPVLSKPINALIAAKLNLNDPSELSGPKVETAPVAEASEEGKSGNSRSPTPPNEPAAQATAPAASSAAVSASATVATTSADFFEQYARLTIATQKLEIVIDIAGSSCRLMKPTTPVFADMLGVSMSPGTLLRRLQRKGVNVLPNAVDLAMTERVTTKNMVLEDQVLLQVAKGSSAFEFTSASWNQSLNESQAGVLLRESNVYACFPQTNDFECVLVEMDEVSTSYKNTPELGFTPGPGALKFTLVHGNEYGNKKVFSHLPRPGEIAHLDVGRTLTKRATHEALERMKNINQRFQKTVHTLLYLVRPYSLG